MRRQAAWDRIVGSAIAAITVLVIFREWGVAGWTAPVVPVLVLGVMAVFATQVGRSRKVFIAVAVGLTGALALTDPDWVAITLRALGAAAFIAAFFSALATLRNVAQTSPAIQQAGRFLSAQKPGRRYAALSVGGQMFALLLNYGAIQLLGALAMSSAKSEPNAEIRMIRTRRMLLAIQRGFISSLPWSPLSFAMAISTTMVPGTSWAQAVVPGLITALIVSGIGWILDTAFKPRLTTAPAPRTDPTGNWWAMTPLVVLLSLLVIGVSTLYALTSVRIVGIVAVIVPVMALVWMVIQHWRTRPAYHVATRVRDYLFAELPGYRGELTLLMMAGYIGTVGAQLLAPVMARAGLDLGALPTWVILVSFVWIIPLAGQVGMNPILAVTLIAPLIPDAASLGVSPTALVVAITAGWTLSGASSPYTATTLLIGSFGGISALRVGLVWNGAYTLICACVLSVWVVIYGLLL
ncbi:hypothetical protein [Sulfitobacter sabulilitoris]|uniref:Permease n=1 Tax=Sulfitobacter sabulilitoris TaxID=2562655 RepID=A0A5S3PC09_9RHOB|nr:hypothetical protein [Sulfitobacter sabulilitoris]TMM51213.1 hypothetical protein FDT80_15235 [Sulfitobacter sabulilitoris]